MEPQPLGDELLTPGGVAALLFVDPKTVTRWAVAGKLDAIRTPGGHRRYLKADVLAILKGEHPDQNVAPIPAPRLEGADPHVAADAQVEHAVATVREFEAADAAESVLVTAAAAVEAADVAATAAARTRRERALAANQAAQTVAREAVRTARRVQIRADVAAAQVEHAAALALEGLPFESVQDDDPEAGRAALLADTVEAAALATAQETAVAAMVVANAVTAAAARVARMVSAADDAFALEVATAAEALMQLTTATAQRVAAETQARAMGVAQETREAVHAHTG
jgi:hypothetical protein